MPDGRSISSLRGIATHRDAEREAEKFARGASELAPVLRFAREALLDLRLDFARDHIGEARSRDTDEHEQAERHESRAAGAAHRGLLVATGRNGRDAGRHEDCSRGFELITACTRMEPRAR